jgi:aspartyl-tRNA(Asn)/glutamyl-tRNA(Gln) amidotransferase subunit B
VSQPRTVASYKVLIGLEVHVQLATATKMFTSVDNGATNFGAKPNSLVDPVILGLPGTLPVINKKAVDYSIMVGLALGCRIARHTKWDRKSYYYPDLPKNYQISQYDMPLCAQGEFEIAGEDGVPKKVRIRRAHLEEDAGKLLHEAPGGYKIDHSIVDLNRAGTPLLEIVTEPDLSSPGEVAAFGQELQKLVQFLGVSEGQMQMGHMRFEPNINVHITDGDGVVHKTAITEIKNLNSFSVLERATAYEIQRQIHEWIDTGSLGKKSTYGWDEAGERTFHQRDKEDAQDYRYFPDPDLPVVEVDEAWLGELKSQVGELPAARRTRYMASLGLGAAEVDAILTDRKTGDFLEQLTAAGLSGKRAYSLIEAMRHVVPEHLKLAELARASVADYGIPAQRVVAVGFLADTGKVAANKDTLAALLRHMLEADVDADRAAADLGLLQSSDTGAIDAAIDALIAKNPPPLQDFRNGKQAAMGALVGMLMKSGKGLNPKMVQERLRERLATGGG